MTMAVLLLLVGLLLIMYAADRFIIGAASFARVFGISPMVIGLTIVALGTSAPEIFVAITSSYYGNPGIAVGGTLGSNIANVLLVLGLSAIVQPIKFARTILKREYLFLCGLVLSTWIMLINEELTRFEGTILLVELLLFIGWLYYRKPEAEPVIPAQLSLRISIIYLLIGLVLLPVSANIIVKNSVVIATNLGVSDLLIGLTIIAIGTSLPEVVTAIAAARKQEHNLLIGNVIGSNIFNLVAVLPFPAFISPGRIQGIQQIDLLVLAISTGLLLLVAISRQTVGTITRLEGLGLVVSYLGYLWYRVALG